MPRPGDGPTGMRGPIARGTIRTSAVLGLRLVVQAGTLLIVARMLGPQHFGAFAGIAALALVLGALATFGTHLVLLGEVAKDPGRRLAVLQYALPTTLVCAGLVFLCYLAIVSLFLHDVGVALRVVALIGIAEIGLQPLLALVVHEHLAQGRVARSQLLQIMPLTLRLVAAAVVWLLHRDDPLAAYAWCYLGASVLALACAYRTLPEPWPRPVSWRLARWAELREAAGYAALNITRASPGEVDKALALKLLPPASAGIYAVSTRVMGAAILPVTAMTLSSLPRLFREGRVKSLEANRLLRWMFGATLAYSSAMGGILWVFSPFLAGIFGDTYHGLDVVLRWLCLALPGMGVRLTAGNALMALGKPWMRVGLEVSGLLVLAAASIALTARIGALGMPLALVCSELSMAIIGVWLIVLSRRPRGSGRAGNPTRSRAGMNEQGGR